MKQLIYCLAFILIVSCTSNTIYKKPENLIPRDSMILLLTDMYIASSAKNYKNKHLQKDVNYTALVYEKYKIDSARFSVSNVYYTSKIEGYADMLKEVKNTIVIKDSIFREQLNIRDSVEGKKNLEKLDKPEEREIHIKDLKSLKLQE